MLLNRIIVLTSVIFILAIAALAQTGTNTISGTYTDVQNSDAATIQLIRAPASNFQATEGIPVLFEASTLYNSQMCRWDFGDGSSEIIPCISTVNHTYSREGAFPARLRIERSTSNLEQTIYIQVNAPPEKIPAIAMEPEKSGQSPENTATSIPEKTSSVTATSEQAASGNAPILSEIISSQQQGVSGIAERKPVAPQASVQKINVAPERVIMDNKAVEDTVSAIIESKVASIARIISDVKVVLPTAPEEIQKKKIAGAGQEQAKAERVQKSISEIRREAEVLKVRHGEERETNNKKAEEAKSTKENAQNRLQQAQTAEERIALRKDIEEAAKNEANSNEKAAEADKKSLEAQSKSNEAELGVIEKIEAKLNETAIEELRKQEGLQQKLQAVADEATRADLGQQLESVSQNILTIQDRALEITAQKEELQRAKQQLDVELEQKTQAVSELAKEAFRKETREEFFQAVKTKLEPEKAPEVRGVERALEIINTKAPSAVASLVSGEKALEVLENVQKKLVIREVIGKTAENLADATDEQVLEAEAQRLEQAAEQRAAEAGQQAASLEQKFEATKENLRVEKEARSFEEVDEEGNLRENTLVTVTFTPEKAMEDVSIYEEIPKEVASDISRLIFYSDNYEVIEPDPLIVWHFAEIKEPVALTYAVKQRIGPEILEGIATVPVAEKISGLEVLEIIEQPEEKKGSLFSIILPALLIPLIGIIIVYFSKFGPEGQKMPQIEPKFFQKNIQYARNPRNSENYVRQAYGESGISNAYLAQVASNISSLRKKGFKDEDIKNELLYSSKFPRSMILKAFQKAKR